MNHDPHQRYGPPPKEPVTLPELDPDLMEEMARKLVPPLDYISPDRLIGGFLAHMSIQERPSWDSTFMQMAWVASLRGTCPSRSVGAVITKANYILTSGYNGAPTGLPHCSEEGCDPDKHGRCTRAVHAELNTIIQAARMGVKIEGGTIYCTDRPCLNCAKAIIQAGLTRVVYWRDDPDSSQRTPVFRLLDRAGLQVWQQVPFSYSL